MIWGTIGLNRRLGPVIFQNIGPGRGNNVNAQRYINQVLAPEIMPYFQGIRTIKTGTSVYEALTIFNKCQ